MGLSPSLWTPNLEGDALDRPYLNQINTITDEQTRPEIRADARSLFPFFDGQTNTLPDRPADFDNPTPESFLNWHSAHQLEYLKTDTRADGSPTNRLLSSRANDPPYNANTEFAAVYDFRAVRIPDGDPLGTGPGLYAILSSDGERVIVINQLRPDSIATLGGFDRTNNAYVQEDQRRLRLMPAFAQLVARPFGLIPDSVDPTTVTDAEANGNAARGTVHALVDTAIDAIRNANGFDPNVDRTELARNPVLAQEEYHYLFLEQLEILRGRLDRMEIFHLDSIGQKIKAISDRFERVQVYKDTSTELDAPFYGSNQVHFRVNSTDRLAAVNAAADVLIGAELRLFELTRASEGIATTQRYEGRYLDAPIMTFLLQNFANYTNEAEAEAEAEDLKQHNQLLEDYTRFQTLLNSTLQAYDPVALAARAEDPDEVDPEVLSIKGVRYDRSFQPPFDPYSEISNFVNLPATTSRPAVNEQIMQVVISMFDERLATNAGAGNTFHPVEKLKNLDRPMGNIVRADGRLFVYTKDTWDKLAVNVAEATKLIGQDTQIRMNQISQTNKEKNRHYELASNSLNRLSSILRAITEVI